MVQNEEHAYRKGVSIIISNNDDAHRLDRFLSDFFCCNTHFPIELIFVDQSESNDYINTLQNYLAESFIIHIRANNILSPHYFKNYAARKAVYPNLLFLSSNIIYDGDLLPFAIEKLADPFIGIVGAGIKCLSDSSKISEHGTLEYMIKYSNFEQHGDKKCSLPISFADPISFQKVDNGFYPYVNDNFMLCRRHDFLRIEGFCEKFRSQFADLDFCLRMTNIMGKKIYFCSSIELQAEN